MAIGLGQLNVFSADSGPGKTVDTKTFFGVQNVEFDFGRSTIIILQSNPYNRLEFQYDNLTTCTFNTASNTLIIGK